MSADETATAAAAELRELIAEAHGLLHDLRAEVKTAQEMTQKDVREMVISEVVRELSSPNSNFQGLLKAASERFCELEQHELDAFTTAGKKLLHAYDRGLDRRWIAVDTLLSFLERGAARSGSSLPAGLGKLPVFASSVTQATKQATKAERDGTPEQ